MKELEAACQAIVENAEVLCLGCSAEWLSDQLFAAIGKRPDIGDQSESHADGCHATIEAAKELVMIACDEINCLCHGQDDLNRVRATIDRLLKGRSE